MNLTLTASRIEDLTLRGKALLLSAYALVWIALWTLGS